MKTLLMVIVIWSTVIMTVLIVAESRPPKADYLYTPRI